MTVHNTLPEPGPFEITTRMPAHLYRPGGPRHECRQVALSYDPTDPLAVTLYVPGVRPRTFARDWILAAVHGALPGFYDPEEPAPAVYVTQSTTHPGVLIVELHQVGVTLELPRVNVARWLRRTYDHTAGGVPRGTEMRGVNWDAERAHLTGRP